MRLKQAPFIENSLSELPLILFVLDRGDPLTELVNEEPTCLLDIDQNTGEGLLNRRQVDQSTADNLLDDL